MLRVILFLLTIFLKNVIDAQRIHREVARGACCLTRLRSECVTKHCIKWISKHCPHKRANLCNEEDRRSSPYHKAKCGTAERNYQPCTSKLIANKLFKSCCDLYVPEECQFMCTYETDQSKTRKMLIDLLKQKRCSIRYMSSILYCASQNRDNRKCCADLDLNASQLQVGSRCLRMCDPSGTAIEKISKQDVTCLYNWNVIMFCHHAGIREM